PYRSVFGSDVQKALAHVEEVIWYEGPEYIAAILVEPIPGTSGVLVPPDGYLRGLRALCDRYGILLILDEVMTGFGRTGRWFGADGEQAPGGASEGRRTASVGRRRSRARTLRGDRAGQGSRHERDARALERAHQRARERAQERALAARRVRLLPLEHALRRAPAVGKR